MQRLVGQARGTGAGGSQIRAAMSVHTVMPLGGGAPAPETGSPELAGQPPTRSPNNIYKGEPGPAAREVPAPRDVPQVLAAVEPVSSPRIVAPIPSVAVESVRVAPRVIERTTSLPQPLLAEAPAPAVTAFAAAPVFNATREGDSRIRPDSPREPTEVHVHIGRIEVLAAPEPAAPKKSQKPVPRPTVPLAEYLARKTRA